MLDSADGVQAKSFNRFHDNKFIPSRMAREIAVDAYSSSMREYYHEGACATVPFIWESQPGTPKHSLRQTRLPPLTPPPSFFPPPPSATTTTTTPSTKKTTQSRKFLFPKIGFDRSFGRVKLSAQSLSSSSPKVQSSPMKPLCDYYYCRRYGFQFEAGEDKSYFKPPSYRCSTYLCFSSVKCSSQNIARRSESHYSSMFKRLIGISTP